MAREKEFFRETVADIYEATGKRILGVNDVKEYLNIGYSKAIKYFDKGETKITIFRLAQRLL